MLANYTHFLCETLVRGRVFVMVTPFKGFKAIESSRNVIVAPEQTTQDSDEYTGVEPTSQAKSGTEQREFGIQEQKRSKVTQSGSSSTTHHHRFQIA